MRDGAPSAIILAKNPRTSSLDELKSYQDNTIYLNNGDEFQIRLFNPLREKIGVQVGINGDLSQGLLVLNPGEDVTLDRFLDDKSKMLYETYTIDGNNQDAVNAAAANGLVNVNFFKEKRVIRPNPVRSRGVKSKSSFGNRTGGITLCGSTTGSFSGKLSSTNINDKWSPILDDADGTIGGNFTTTGSADYAILNNVNGMGNVSPTASGQGETLTSSNNMYFSASFEGDVTLDGNFSSPGIPIGEKDLSFVSDPAPEVIKETGRIEKGNESAQNLNEVNVEFETFSFYQITYYLKPTSERGSTTVTESRVRDYCPECGYRIRNTRWNFCPKCGDEV